MLANSSKQPVQLGKTKQKLLRLEYINCAKDCVISMGFGEVILEKCPSPRRQEVQQEKNSQLEVILLPSSERPCHLDSCLVSWPPLE